MKTVETMARAMLAEMKRTDGDWITGWQEIQEAPERTLSCLALAALKSIREPSNEMIDASQREDIGLEEEVYTAMIDAAILEATQ